MRVLVAVDVRDANTGSFVDDVATWVARDAAITVDLAYVTRAGPTWLGGALARAFGAGRAAEADDVEARLIALSERLPAGRRGDLRRWTGYPLDGLVAASAGVDLLVLAARARTGMDRAVLGSLSQAVVRRAACPVLVLTPGARAPAHPRLLFGVDLRGAAAGLDEVATWAQALGATVDLAHIDAFQAHFPYVLDADLRAECEREWQEARAADLEALRVKLASLPADTRGEARIEDGDPVDELRRLALGVDVVVLATHGRTGPQRWWLGSVAERLVQDCPKPMLILRAKEA
jgi:nucleotide-binding universal stress UspA family protein